MQHQASQQPASKNVHSACGLSAVCSKIRVRETWAGRRTPPLPAPRQTPPPRQAHPAHPTRIAQTPCRYEPPSIRRGDEGEQQKRELRSEHRGRQHPLIRHRHNKPPRTPPCTASRTCAASALPPRRRAVSCASRQSRRPDHRARTGKVEANADGDIFAPTSTSSSAFAVYIHRYGGRNSRLMQGRILLG